MTTGAARDGAHHRGGMVFPKSPHVLICIAIALIHSPQVSADAKDALPGIMRVGSAQPLDLGVVFSARSGYGFRGATINGNDKHHRGIADFSTSFRFTEWLGLGVGVDGRYDTHSGTETQDDGWIADFRVSARLKAPFAFGPLGVSGQFNLRFPNAERAVDVAKSISADTLLLMSYQLGSAQISGNFGFRFDRTANTVSAPELLSRADRLAVGASDSNAVLLGGGVVYPAGDFELLGEATWDLLVGKAAPKATQSPARIGFGTRYRLSDTLKVAANVELSPNEAPNLAPMSPLVPLEPRFSATIGLVYRMPSSRQSTNPIIAPLVRPPAPEPEVHTFLTGRIVDDSGEGIAGVLVELIGPTVVASVESGTAGVFLFRDPQPGSATIKVTAEGYLEKKTNVTIGAKATTNQSIVLESANAEPGQVRGRVRAERGPIRKARVTVEPGGQKTITNRRGDFSIELPQGDYQITIHAKGFRSQTHSLKVTTNDVTIWNVDLSRAARRNRTKTRRQ